MGSFSENNINLLLWIEMRSTLKGENLLLLKQILSFKSWTQMRKYDPGFDARSRSQLLFFLKELLIISLVSIFMDLFWYKFKQLCLNPLLIYIWNWRVTYHSPTGQHEMQIHAAFIYWNRLIKSVECKYTCIYYLILHILNL